MFTPILRFLLPASCLAATLLAQNSAPLRARAVFGPEGVPTNAAGHLSIDDSAILFSRSEGLTARIPLSAIQGFLLSEEDKQVGGIPLVLGRAATPYGGGRVIGLFSHKKYDFLTMEYFDANGGFHATVYQLNRGEGETLEKELIARGVRQAGATVAPGIATMPAAGLTAKDRRGARWSVQMERIAAGDSNVAPEFKAAIYENLVGELSKTKQFSAVLRSGDHNANGVSNLLTLKTTVEAFTAGSETRRAVTTVTGATKLKVRIRLCTEDGKPAYERVIDGNVRFFGGNLRQPTPSRIASQRH